mgnify:CR=1 FL=1
MVDYDSIIRKFKGGKRFLVVSHSSPDGDAIGSTIAMGIFLEMMGKEATLYNVDGVPANLRFLPRSGSVVSSDRKSVV